MIRASTVTLLTGTPEPRGVFQTPVETGRDVYCEVMSVGMKETYEAMASGYAPEVKLFLHDYAEYQRERCCIFEGIRYRILRSYIRNDYGIELVLEREEGLA